MVFLTVLVTYEVVSRRLLHQPHVWSFEITTFLFSTHFMIVAGYALLHNSHVNVDIIYARLSRRWQAGLDAISYLIFFLPFVTIFVTAGTEYAAASWATGEKTLTARLPLVMPLMKTVIPLAGLLLLLQGLAQFIRNLFLFIQNREL